MVGQIKTVFQQANILMEDFIIMIVIKQPSFSCSDYKSAGSRFECHTSNVIQQDGFVYTLQKSGMS